MATSRLSVPAGFVSVKQAADILDTTPMTIWRMRKRGQLSCLKDPRNGHNVIIIESEVRKLAEQLTVSAAS